MSEPTSTYVFDPHGPTHTGTGPQYIQFTSGAGARSRSPRRQAADELSWLEQRFVYPSGFGSARDKLESHRTVFLDAPPGSGRTLAAKMLLWELGRHVDNNLYEILLEADSESRLDPSHIDDGDRAWLDLSQIDPAAWIEVQPELSSLRGAVRERGAHLVVVLPHGADNLRLELSPYRVQLERPSTDKVLDLYLKLEGIKLDGPSARLQPLDEKRSLEQISRYAQLIVEAKAQSSDQGTLQTWSDIAYRAWIGHDHEVAELVATLDQGGQRALLLATAMLHGAHADIIHRAENSLLRLVGHPPDDAYLLERSTIDQRLSKINASIDDSGHVRFRELDYDSAVRTYFWIGFPDLREHLPRWVARVVNWPEVSEAESEHVLESFTELALPERYRSLWVSLVDDSADGAASSNRSRTAALILRRGLRDARHGRTFRRQIYDWSTSDLSDWLANVIIEACRDQMAVSHPDEALVRLHHLARRERHERNDARHALLGLARGDRRLLRLMLHRVTDMSPEKPRWRSADTALFLSLVAPEELTDPGTGSHPLIAEQAVRGQLVDGWRFAFAEHPEAWQMAAVQWLNRAVMQSSYRGLLVDVLVEAGRDRGEVLARLYAMTRGRELRASISDLMLKKINAIQGVQYA